MSSVTIMQIKKHLFHVEHLGIMRDVVRKFLENDQEITLTQSQDNCNELMQQLKDKDIDILILGNAAPAAKAIDYPVLCKNILLQFPSIKIIVHTVYATSINISSVMNAGAYAFVTKDMGLDDITVAINAVKRNARYISKESSSFFQNHFEFLAGLVDKLEHKKGLFTTRELEILNYLARGLTTREIANSLNISLKTVETHRKNLVSKAKVKNTAELIAYSSSSGYLAF